MTSPGNLEAILRLILGAEPGPVQELLLGVAMLRSGVAAITRSFEASEIPESEDLRDWNLTRAVRSVGDSVDTLVDALAFGAATVVDDEDET